MVREITVEELPRLTDLALSFFKEAGLPGVLKPDIWKSKWAGFISANTGRVFVIDEDGIFKGALGCFITEDINDGELVATEAFWIVDKEYRGGQGHKLLIHYEQWAAKAGCKRLTMVHLNRLQPEKLSALYQRMGYVPIETYFMKTI